MIITYDQNTGIFKRLTPLTGSLPVAPLTGTASFADFVVDFPKTTNLALCLDIIESFRKIDADGDNKHKIVDGEISEKPNWVEFVEGFPNGL